MSIKEKIMNKLLNKSNSYRYYKDYYDKRNGTNYKKELNSLKKEFRKIKRQNDKFQQRTMDQIDSCNFLFNNLYLDYEHEPRKTLQDIKLLCNEVLSFVDNVCSKYEIEWWLDYGNLLGAVRHGDYVPWDDDVDIGMIRSDYNIFNNHISEEIERNGIRDLVSLDYRRREVGDTLIHSFIQLWVKKPINDVPMILAGVDIFPYDYLTDYDYQDLNELYYNSKIKYFDNLANKMSYQEGLEILYEDLGLSMEKTDWLIPGVEGSCGPDNLYRLMVLENSKIFPLKKLEYGNKVFPVPNDSNYYLSEIYGDYMNIPKSIRRHSRVNNFRYEDVSDLFDECIERLRVVNERF